jgi:DNA-binding transcriptional LysR family regulator
VDRRDGSGVKDIAPTHQDYHFVASVITHFGQANAANALKCSASRISGATRRVEKHHGVKCYKRRPYAPLWAGNVIAHAVEKQDEEERAMTTVLKNHKHPHLIVGGPQAVLTVVSEIMPDFETRCPNVCAGCRCHTEAEVVSALDTEQVDIAIAHETGFLSHFHKQRLTELRLAILAPMNAPVRSSRELFGQKVITEPLLVSSTTLSLATRFQQDLDRLEIQWSNWKQLGTLGGVLEEVAKGRGYGLGVNVPKVVTDPQVQVWPLMTFSPILIAAYWKIHPTLAMREYLQLLRRLAKQLEPTFIRG